MSTAHARIWVGIDAGKGHNWAVALDASGETVFDERPALATALTEAENAGHDPEQLLQHTARQRALDDARSTASTLTWRIQRLAARQVPSARARTAQARTSATARPARRELRRRPL